MNIRKEVSSIEPSIREFSRKHLGKRLQPENTGMNKISFRIKFQNKVSKKVSE